MSRPASKAVNQLAEAVRLHHVRLRDLAGTFTGLARERHLLALKRHQLAEAGEAVAHIRIGEATILAEIAGHVTTLAEQAEG